ncbi:N-terminal double-transmembrane domain-containing protein [Dyadobacter sp. SG02]|uniref:BatA domain-containing protein n=1 Tax=Dyadobacter sp. SG02 TaxID=1855291 RepID=UPI0008D4AC41|nr:BatA domain-containing protein [Dyadobacter sp. SG02]SEJ64793.1 N-terminal double-transmembrane domain-containing protein [Dyadobacter sp. SG02]
MALLQPNMLWGMLAVAVPVAIHFWYQKRGKTIEWAAMRWLGEQTTLQHRGLRLNEVWLMILRCFLVILLALILSKPVIDRLGNVGKREVIHLVQADRLVTETYRFELEKAGRNGEPIYRLGAMPEKVDDLAKTADNAGQSKYLQQNINALADGNAKDFRLYFRNDGSLNARIYVPGEYQLFPAADSSRRKPIDILKNKPVYKGIIKVLLDYREAGERQTVQAALSALTEVYGFNFEITNKKGPASHYDWVFTDERWTDFQPGTTYVISGNAPQWDVPAQVIQLRDTLRMADSELVESGRLPEWLGDLLVQHLGLQTDNPPLSRSQLNALFEKVPVSRAQEYSAMRSWLLLVLILLMAAERWLALRKTGTSHG